MTQSTITINRDRNNVARNFSLVDTFLAGEWLVFPSDIFLFIEELFKYYVTQDSN